MKRADDASERKPCQRCGQLVELTKAGGLMAHGWRGAPCKAKGRCRVCHEVVYIDRKGRAQGHKRWDSKLGHVDKCSGVGLEAL